MYLQAGPVKPRDLGDYPSPSPKFVSKSIFHELDQRVKREKKEKSKLVENSLHDLYM